MPNQDYKNELEKLTKEVDKLKTAHLELEKSIIKVYETTKKAAKTQEDLLKKNKAGTEAVEKLTKAQKAEAEMLRLATNAGKKEIEATVKLAIEKKKLTEKIKEGITGAKAAAAAQKKLNKDHTEAIRINKARSKAQEKLNKDHERALIINKKLNSSTKKSNSIFSSFTKSILASGAAFFGAGAIINGVKKLVGGLYELSKQMQGESIRAAVVFGDQLEYVEQEADKLAKKMGVTTREFVSMSAATADLLIPLDFTRKEAANMSVELQKLTGALDEWTAGSVGAKEISNILTKAMLGENEQLKRLGIAIRKDTDEYRDLVKVKLQTKGVTKAQAEALATLELIQKKSTDAQTAYTASGNKLLRLEKEFKLILREKKENFIKLFDIEKKQPNLYRLENKELTTLFASLKNTNLSQDARNKLLQEVNTKYGSYLPNLLTEQSTLEDIAKAEESINKQLRLKVIQQAFQEEINTLIKAELAAKEQIVNAEILADKASQQRIAAVTELGALEAEQNKKASEFVTALAQGTIDNNAKEIASTEDKFKRIGELYGIAYSEIESVLNENTENIIENNKVETDAILTRSEAYKISNDAITSEMESILDSLEENIQEEIDSTVEGAERMKDGIGEAYAATTEELKGTSELFKKAIEDDVKELLDGVSTTLSTVKDVTNEYFNYKNSLRDSEIEGIERQRDAEVAAAEAKGEDTSKIEAKFAKKEAKLRAEKAKAEKRQAIINININTALGIVKTIGSVGFPWAIPLIAAIVAIGAIQLANVQKTNSYGDGEINIKGKKHSQGGINANIEGGESVITAKGTANAPTLLEAINKGFIKDSDLLPSGAKMFGADTKELYLNQQSVNLDIKELVKEQQLTRQAILNKPTEQNIYTSGGHKKIVKTANSSQHYIDTYLRSV